MSKVKRSKNLVAGELVFQKKEFFLDRAIVKQMIKDSGQSPRKLIRAGSWVRKIARRTIKVRKRKYSEPGNPPNARKRSSQMRNFSFQWDPSIQGMIVGSVFRTNRYGTPVPQVHEHGGTLNVTVRTNKRKKDFYKKGKPSRKLQRAVKRRAKKGLRVVSMNAQYKKVPTKYPSRSFMRPALETSTPKLLEIFNASITNNPNAGVPV